MIIEFFNSKFNFGKREAGKIIKQIHILEQKNKFDIIKNDQKNQEIDFKRYNIIEYDKNDIIDTDKGIILRSTNRDGDPVDLEILNTNFEVLFKVKEPYGDNIYRYIIKIGKDVFFPKTIKEILIQLEPITQKGPIGRDILKKIINTRDKEIKQVNAEHIVGWSDGWKLPFTQEKLGMRLISYTTYQKKIQKRCENIIKIYTPEEKEKIIKKLKRFIEITDIDKDKLSIILSYNMIAPFRIDVLKFFRNFPLLILYGDPESGKSEILDFSIIDFFGVWDNHLSPNQIGNAAKLEDWLSTSSFPIFISEVEKIKDPEVLNIIKDHCTSTGLYTRKTGPLDAYERLRTAALVIDGNIFPKELKTEAIISRSIIIHINKHIKKNWEWIDLKRELKKIKFFSFFYEHTKDWDQKKLFEELTEIRKSYITEGWEDQYRRLIPKYLILLYGKKLFKDIYGIDLPSDNYLKTLINGELQIQQNFIDVFKTFCDNAIKFNSEEFGLKYLQVGLYEKKNGDFIFTNENLRDFNEFVEKILGEKYTLVDIEKKIKTGLKNKNLIEYKTNNVNGKTRRSILINKRLLNN